MMEYVGTNTNNTTTHISLSRDEVYCSLDDFYRLCWARENLITGRDNIKAMELKIKKDRVHVSHGVLNMLHEYYSNDLLAEDDEIAVIFTLYAPRADAVSTEPYFVALEENWAERTDNYA